MSKITVEAFLAEYSDPEDFRVGPVPRLLAATKSAPPPYTTIEASLEPLNALTVKGTHDGILTAFEQTVLDRLSRLEARQTRTEEALALAPPERRQAPSQQHTRRRPRPVVRRRRPWWVHRFWRHFQAAWHRVVRRLYRARRCSRWLQVQITRAGCYWDLFAAKGIRFTTAVWPSRILGGVFGGPSCNDLAEARRDAWWWEEWALETLRALRKPVYALPR